MATIGTGNSKLFFSRSKKLFKVLFTLISIASPVILAIASSAILADENSVTARTVCADFRGDSRKYDLAASAIWTEPLRYTISNENTAIFRQAFIGLAQQEEFEKIISRYEIQLIESCVDSMTLVHPVTVTQIDRSAFHANVPNGSRFVNLTNVLFEGVREVGDDLHEWPRKQKLNHVRFEGIMNDILLRYVDAEQAVFDPAGGDNHKRIFDLRIFWSNIRYMNFTDVAFNGDSRIEWADVAGAQWYNADIYRLEIRCTNLSDPKGRYGGQLRVHRSALYGSGPPRIAEYSKEIRSLDSCRSQ